MGLLLTQFPAWRSSGPPEVGVTQSASMLLAMDTAALTDLSECLRRLGAAVNQSINHLFVQKAYYTQETAI